MKYNFAKTKNMNAWLRHPVLGDPSFDTFERLGESVHISAPPYEWAVNGSLFRDFDGAWYYYAGLYAKGYASDVAAHFRIYRSRDKGMTWEDLGWGFEEGFCFEGFDIPFDVYPDAFVTYDKKLGKYLLTYDTASNNCTWETAYSPEYNVDSGVGVAISDSPAGPFVRLPKLTVSNRAVHGTFGIYTRIYASCVVPRKNDYIAFCLADSERHFSWALTVLTSPTLEGPWSLPTVVLGCDRKEYYPCPIEFFPVEIHGDKVIARGTSVAMNRNYQVTFVADLEKAHDPSAWTMTDDGNVWHAHDHPDEHFGIWGQTIHGFIEDNQYVVMHASRNAEDLGTLGVAIRDAGTPHSDGFTMTSHVSPSVSPLKASYGEFTLKAELTFKGTADICFDYLGTLGPNQSTADASVSKASLCNYHAIRLCGDSCSLVTVCSDKSVITHASTDISGSKISLELSRDKSGRVSARINGQQLCDCLQLANDASPIAVALDSFSRIECSSFEIEGDALPYTWKWNAEDALLGAGQYFPEPTVYSPDADIAPNIWHRTDNGYVGEGNIRAKWNLHGNSFEVNLYKHQGFGTANIFIDGVLHGSIDLCGAGTAKYMISGLYQGAHSVTVEPEHGRIGILGIRAFGELPK